MYDSHRVEVVELRKVVDYAYESFSAAVAEIAEEIEYGIFLERIEARCDLVATHYGGIPRKLNTKPYAPKLSA